VAELPQTLLRSIGKIHFNQNLITKWPSIFSSLKRTG
jgi:hypothetical protein